MTERHSHEVIEIKGARFCTQAIKSDLPGLQLKAARLLIRVGLVPPEFIGIVVVSSRVLGGQALARILKEKDVAVAFGR